MLRNSVLTAAVLLAFSSFPLNAQESAADLAKKLGSRSFQEREKAAQKLETLGVKALPILRDSCLSADLETKRRTVAVMDRIEERWMQDQIIQATPVHVRLKGVPLRDALLQVEKQTRLRLAAVEDTTAVTVDTGVLPYWRAWRAFCQSTKSSERDFALTATTFKLHSNDQLQPLYDSIARRNFGFRPMPTMPAVGIAGPGADDPYSEDARHSMRVRVRWFQLLRPERPGTPTLAVFAIELRAEPRLQYTAFPRVRITKIIDADGKDIPVRAVKPYANGDTPDAEVYLGANTGEIQRGGLLHLHAVEWEGPMRPLMQMEGKVLMEFGVRPPVIEITNAYKAVGKEARSHDGIALKIMSVDQKSRQLRVRIENHGTGMPLDVALERIELRTSNGWICEHVEATYARTEDGKGRYADYTFEAPPNPAQELTLALVKQRRSVAVEMPFLVKDVRAK